MIWTAERRQAHALLADLLQEQGVAPVPTLARREGGKPWFPGRPELCFNLSHSGPWSLCALAEGEVGCDIELVRPRRAGLPAYVLGGAELEWFQKRGERWEDFYTLWTLKEARVKCTGAGIRGSMRTIPVPLLESGQSAWQDGFFFTALAGEGWRGAVCEQKEPPADSLS